MKGYSNGKYVPYGEHEIPKNKTVILTFLEEDEEDSKDKLLKRVEKLCDRLKEDDTVLGEEFDKILSERVRIEREIDL